MRQKMVAANWKMNGRAAEVSAFAAALSALPTEAEKVFAPPAVYLHIAQQANKGFALSAQTAAAFADGAFTGEIGMSMLTDMGCQYVILGHSERRALYGETDKVIFEKVQAALANDITPILCIGETDEENQTGQTEAVMAEQLSRTLTVLTPAQKQRVVIAYEPVWAIGTGRTPSLEDVQSIHEKIRYLFSQNDDTISHSVRILYGGSVKPDNAAAIFALPDVDGGLVGGASLTIESFEKIIKAL